MKLFQSKAKFLYIILAIILLCASAYFLAKTYDLDISNTQTMETDYRLDASHLGAILKNVEKIVVYVENWKCDNSISVPVEQCYPALAENHHPLPEIIKPYYLGERLKEVIERKYTRPSYVLPKHDIWGRRQQPVEVILDRKEAYGPRMVEYKKNPKILFVYLQSTGGLVGNINGQRLNMLHLSMSINRYSPEIGPFLAKHRSCYINIIDDQIEEKLDHCFSNPFHMPVGDLG